MKRKNESIIFLIHHGGRVYKERKSQGRRSIQVLETAGPPREAKGGSDLIQDGAREYNPERTEAVITVIQDGRWRLKRAERRGAPGVFLPSFKMAAAVGAVPGSAPRTRPHLSLVPPSAPSQCLVRAVVLAQGERALGT